MGLFSKQESNSAHGDGMGFETIQMWAQLWPCVIQTT